MSLTLNDVLRTAALRLKDAAERPMHEAHILLAHHLGKDRLWVITHSDETLENPDDFFGLVARRQAHEPIEYITQHVSFYSQDFFIAAGALIPRPETELLIERVMAGLPQDFKGHIVEVGIGSGIISIVLAQHFLEARLSAVDISPAALDVARVNIARFGLEDRIRLYEGSLLDPVLEPIDAVVSNPPYIQEGVKLEKPLNYEPQNALFGGKEGDEILRTLIDAVFAREIPFLACEMGYDQKAPLEKYVTINPHFSVEFYKDLAGLDRGFIMRKKDA